MKIHTDKLEEKDLHFALAPTDLSLQVIERGSRKRARAFDVSIVAEPGYDRYGIKRRAGNATWAEWGDFICDLFVTDPTAIVGQYTGWREFIRITIEQAPKRPDYEGDVDRHPPRWHAWLTDFAEKDRKTINNTSLPIEQRRAAFKRHNARQQPTESL